MQVFKSQTKGEKVGFTAPAFYVCREFEQNDEGELTQTAG